MPLVDLLASLDQVIPLRFGVFTFETKLEQYFIFCPYFSFKLLADA